MIVWRVENASGEGPYLHNDVSMSSTWRHPDWESEDWSPNTMRDVAAFLDLSPIVVLALYGQAFQFEERPDLRAGFISCEQMRAWWTPKQMARLAEHGYTPVPYRVAEEHVLVGKRQLIFKHSHAEHARREHGQKILCPIGA